MIAAGTTGLIAATAAGQARAAARGRLDTADGTPEQIHLTWDDAPTRTIVVSWASPGQAVRPRVRIGQRVIPATERTSADPLSGAVTWTYHARVDGLRPGATYGYAVTTDNDGNVADPFSATFTTAPEGRAAFRFTSFGDLATPNPAWATSGRAPYAVGAVETFQPLFHLLNGDLACAELSPGADPAAWAQVLRDCGNSVQGSAASRPWLPVPGSHAPEAGAGAAGLASFLTRYALPPNGVDGLEGRWYAFRVGAVLFVCLSGDDVTPGRGYSGGAQTAWLESTLAAARADSSVDWIIVQFHQAACSSAPDGNGSGLGARRQWLPLFDAYEVDLVLSGHHDTYERSFPVRGVRPLAGGPTRTSWPRPVTTADSGVFDTSQGTVHLALGGGVLPAPRVAGDGAGPDGAARTAARQARRAPSTGYGIAVFDVHPGHDAGGQTSISVRYYHAAGQDPANLALGAPADDFTLFDSFTLLRPRSDGRRWHPQGALAT